MIRFQHDAESDTTWATDIQTDNEGSIQWVMRYGSDAAVLEAARQAATLINYYAVLVDPNITQSEAIDKLKRARRCAAQAWKEAK